MHMLGPGALQELLPGNGGVLRGDLHGLAHFVDDLLVDALQLQDLEGSTHIRWFLASL